MIDIAKDYVMMFGQKLNIQTTSTQHYCVNTMRNNKESTDDENLILIGDGNIEESNESRLLRALKSKAVYNNKTTDNIESDDSADADKENMDAAGNTENNDDFLRDVHQDDETKDEDFGTTANIEQGR